MASPTTATKPSRNGTRKPGDDRPIGDDEGVSVIDAIASYKREAEQARESRMRQNRRNVEMFLGYQDWSHKTKGQSKQVLPKVAMAVEQHAAFVQRGLTDSGRWFSIELPPDAQISADACEKLLRQKLETLSRDDSYRLDFATLLSDAIKVGLLQSLLVLKVSGFMRKRKQYVVKRKNGTRTVTGPDGMPQKVDAPTESVQLGDTSEWQLVIDLVRPADYYPDPTGRGLYEIQEIERDISEVVAMSKGEDPIYDPKVVALLEEDCAQREEADVKAREQNQTDTTAPGFRKRVTLLEFWGNLLGSDGRVVHENCVAVVANGRYLIRPPEPNPFWHQQSPFVAAPLTRVPFSVWHKALMDHAVSLNIAQDELFSLMIDGSMAVVWGTRQLRPNMLEDPKQVSDGIPQGATLLVKDELPAGAKVLEQVTTGQVPPDAMNMWVALDGQFQDAARTSATKQGQLPQRTTKATEIVATERAADVFSDSLIRNLEDCVIEPALWKAWCCLLQHAEDLDSQEVIQAIGLRGAFALSQMSAAQRFAAYAGCRFRVKGLSAIAARQQDFQKTMALVQASGANPILANAFMQTLSGPRIIQQLIRSLNIDPTLIQLTEEEKTQQAQAQQFARVAATQQHITGGQGSQPALGGGAGLQGQINQQVNPMTGLTANA